MTDEELETINAAIDRMGWAEIKAFKAELHRGQDIYEDAGGYFLRCIKSLFGIKSQQTVTTHQEAARKMVKAARAAIANAHKED